VARNAQPGNLRGKTLHVVVSDSVWKQELFMLKGLIADKLNSRLKSNVVEKISFLVGRVDRRPMEKKQPKQVKEVKIEV
jgi:predicted nucleic acid-binding Zn ribbon protein